MGMQVEAQNSDAITLQTVFAALQQLLAAQDKIGLLAKELWSTSDIAEYMDISQKSVVNLVANHKTFPKCRKVLSGGRRWYSKEVRAWVEKQRSSKN